MADGQDGERREALQGEVVSKEHAENLEFFAALRSILDSKATELFVTKNFEVREEQAKAEAERSKLDHELKMLVAKNNKVLGLAVIILIGILVVAMVVCVQAKILDESTVQKLAIVVLALFSATAARSKS